MAIIRLWETRKKHVPVLAAETPVARRELMCVSELK